MLEKTEQSLTSGFDIHTIMETLPHRYPFLLVDRVTEMEQGKYITGYKNVSMNEAFFQGHFPNMPLMPGVLIIESLAQLGSILVSYLPEGEGKIALFAGINEVRFRRQVIPGDKLELHVELLKLKGSLGKAYGKATVDGERVADGEILFFLQPKNGGTV